MNKLICKCDDSCNSCIGPTLGAHITNLTTSEVFEFSEHIGNLSDTNLAEGRSIKMALNKLMELNVQNDLIIIYSDISILSSKLTDYFNTF